MGNKIFQQVALGSVTFFIVIGLMLMAAQQVFLLVPEPEKEDTPEPLVVGEVLTYCRGAEDNPFDKPVCFNDTILAIKNGYVKYQRDFGDGLVATSSSSLEAYATHSHLLKERGND